MRSMILAAAVLIMGCGCAQREEARDVEQRISNVENGLIVFDMASYDPQDLFRPDSARLADPRPLAERMEYYKVPGVSIAVIDDYRIDWARAYGVMDVNTNKPVTRETIFEAGSTSKLVTAVMALRFVQDGMIELDRDVNAYLKSWKVPENEFTSEEKVTLRMLLTHRAGMPETGYDTDDSGDYPTLLDVLNGVPPAVNAPAEPEREPGGKWRYSNVAYNVVQLLLEDLSGRPFAELAEEMVFEPLGMSSSSFVYPLEKEKEGLEAMPHDADGISRKPLMHLTALSHGGLTTTPTDLARFTVELMLSYEGKSARIISRETTMMMFQKVCTIDQSQMPLPFFQGLGVFVMDEGRDLLFTHPGSNNPGLQCWLIGWPERGTGAVIMANGARGLFLGIEIINAVIREYNR